MVVVFHDAQSKASNDEAMQRNYVEYGRRLEKMIGEIKGDRRTAINRGDGTEVSGHCKIIQAG